MIHQISNLMENRWLGIDSTLVIFLISSANEEIKARYLIKQLLSSIQHLYIKLIHKSKKSSLMGPKFTGNYLTTIDTFESISALYISLLGILVTGYIIGMCLNFIL